MTFTHHSTNLIVLGGVNITTAAGDECELVEYALGDFRMTSYSKASGLAVVAAADENNLVLLETLTASSSANLSFTSGIDDTYRTYCFIFSEVLPASDGAILQMVASTNGGSSYLTTGIYGQHVQRNVEGNDSYTANFGTGSSQLSIGYLIGNASIEAGLGGNIYIDNPSGAVRQKMIRGFYSHTSSSNAATGGAIIGAIKTATALNAFRFQMDSRNIASGTIKLYGIK